MKREGERKSHWQRRAFWIIGPGLSTGDLVTFSPSEKRAKEKVEEEKVKENTQG